MLVDRLQDVDELLAEEAGSDADLAAQRAGDLVAEVAEIVGSDRDTVAG